MPFTPTYDVPPDRRAYTLTAGKVGCLMLHGFMGSPKSSRPLAQYLHQRGVTVHCPLLPGHGHLPEKIHGFSQDHWLAEVEEALAHLRQLCDQVFITAHSMGTVLAAHLSTLNHDLRGLIMLAPLYDVPDQRIRYLRVLRYLMPWFYPMKHRRVDRQLIRERVLDFDPTINLGDPAVQQWLVKATRVPTAAIDEMRKMADFGRRLWPRLHLPVLIFQGGRDYAVFPADTQKLFDLLPGPDKELQLIPEAGHELMRPSDPVH
ncbi:MAG: alpha/beta fold hydrolase, partial [Chloroflexota bacterium]